jgi:hypothetical protein
MEHNKSNGKSRCLKRNSMLRMAYKMTERFVGILTDYIIPTLERLMVIDLLTVKADIYCHP